MSVSSRSGLLAAALAVLVAGAAAAGVRRPACHGTPSRVRLHVTAEGVRSSRGYLVANLYGANKRRWLADHGWLHVWRDPAHAGAQTMCMYLPAPGIYALVMFHDANANGILDLGPLGPTEEYGFSNNVRPLLAAPSLKSASFRAKIGDTRLRIRLHAP